MPPKVKVTKEDIINTALEMYREKGGASINARSIAASLGCSTQPIFSNFDNMDKLNSAVMQLAYEHYYGFCLFYYEIFKLAFRIVSAGKAVVL